MTLKKDLNAKLFYELKKEIFEQEYHNTINGDWAINNEDNEQKIFNELSEKGQKLYAIEHARKYTKEMLKMSLIEFTQHTDLFNELLEDKIFDEDYYIDLEHETEKIINSKFTKEELNILCDDYYKDDGYWETIHMLSQDLANHKLRKKYKKYFKDYKKYVDENLSFIDTYYLQDYKDVKKLNNDNTVIIIV